MGIDVYLEWDRMTETEEQARFTGYSVESGHVGYLREAYHGGPYATAYLITEDWDDQPEGGYIIAAAELKRRLPSAVLASIYRHHIVYGESIADPSIINLDNGGIATLTKKLSDIFAGMAERQNRDYMPNEEQVRAAEVLIANRALPKYALAFADFVALAERKEQECGKPCRIVVSA